MNPTATKSTTYEYKTKTGGSGYIIADSAEQALASLGKVGDADPHSGIITPPIEPAVLSSASGRNVVNNKINPVLTNGESAIGAADKYSSDYKSSQDQNGGYQMPDDLKNALTAEAEEKARIAGIFADNQAFYKRLAVANTHQAEADIASLQADWDMAHEAQVKANDYENAVYKQAGFRTGQARYAPELNASMLTGVQSEGIARLSKLDAGYRAAIAKVRGALEANNLQVAMQASREALQYHQDALAEIQDQKKVAQDLADKARQASQNVSRQAAIIDLVRQGVTDPKQLFDYLNFDDQGRQTGDITAEEIDGVLKKIMPEGSAYGFKFSNNDVGKLLATGLNVQEIQQIQDDLLRGGYDAVIQGLTGTQRAAVSKILDSSTGGVSGGSLTISEARDLGVPLSLVGRSQPQILSDLSSTQPPQWFSDYLQQHGDAVVPQSGATDTLQSMWDQFRQRVNDDFVQGHKAGYTDTGDINSQIDAYVNASS